MSEITELVPRDTGRSWGPLEPVPPDEDSDCNYRFVPDDNQPDMPRWSWSLR